MYWYPEYTFWKQNNTYAEFYKDEAIDMLYLSLAVFAADRLILRETGEDAWSRKIELYMSFLCVDKWNVCQSLVEVGGTNGKNIIFVANYYELYIK